MKLLILNGPNLNLLGRREPALYGTATYDDLLRRIEQTALELDLEACVYQSNHEGDLVDQVQAAYGVYDGIVLNPAAYTHTSVALLDALLAVSIPTVEVHLTDLSKREAFRRFPTSAPLVCDLYRVGHRRIPKGHAVLAGLPPPELGGQVRYPPYRPLHPDFGMFPVLP